ncbi:MAG: 3-isopropylmalate dehydrogenase [Chlamydiales bacterium]
MKKKILVLSGDGIGPEIMAEAIKVLKAVERAYGHEFTFINGLVGGAAWDVYGEHLPSQTLALSESCDAILFGSVGGPVEEQHMGKWKGCEANALLTLRKHFGFITNLRPSKVYPSLSKACVLREDIISGGVDILCVRACG